MQSAFYMHLIVDLRNALEMVKPNPPRIDFRPQAFQSSEARALSSVHFSLAQAWNRNARCDKVKTHVRVNVCKCIHQMSVSNGSRYSEAFGCTRSERSRGSSRIQKALNSNILEMHNFTRFTFNDACAVVDAEYQLKQ